MLSVVKNHVRSRNKVSGKSGFFSSIHIAIEPREIAARNLKPQRVPAKKNVARSPEIDRNLINLLGIH
jgi:hypothetical protein